MRGPASTFYVTSVDRTASRGPRQGIRYYTSRVRRQQDDTREFDTILTSITSEDHHATFVDLLAKARRYVRLAREAVAEGRRLDWILEPASSEERVWEEYMEYIEHHT